MWIFLFLLIPLFTAGYLCYKYPKTVTWWEALLVILIPTLVVLGIKYSSQESVGWSREYWTSCATEAQYYEEWNELVAETHYTYDSDGNITGSYVTYHTEWHSPRWEMVGSCGEHIGIPQNTYVMLKNRWANESFIDLRRSYHTKDGDEYVTKWNKQFASIESITTSHLYRNKVKVSNSVFNFKKIDAKTTKVVEYNPINTHKCDFIYGWDNQGDQEYLRKWNAYTGAKKKVALMVMVFKNRPLEDAFIQESYWKGGNKNEFIVCVGVSSNTITWAHIISWTPLTTLKVQVVREIVDMKTLNMFQLLKYLGETINSVPNVVRRDFREFDYLTVPVPWWGYVLALILCIGCSIGMAIFVVENDFTNEGE